MTQISRRNINKGLAWSVPAAVVAGTAPAFAASPTDPTDPPVVPETPTIFLEAEVAGVTAGRAETHTADTVGQPLQTPNGTAYIGQAIALASGQGAVNWIGGNNGTVTFNFTIPAGATNFQLQMIHLPHPSENSAIHYVVNETAFSEPDIQLGTGEPNQAPQTQTLDASALVSGNNTITFGNPAGVPFGYLDAIRVTYLLLPF